MRKILAYKKCKYVPCLRWCRSCGDIIVVGRCQRSRLSWWRLVLLFLMICCIGYGTCLNIRVEPFPLHHLFFISWVACMIQKWNWLSEAYVKLYFSIILFNLNISHSLAHIIKILWGLNYIFYEIWSLKQMILPKVEEVMLKQLHLSHQRHSLSLDILHLFLENLDFSFVCLFQIKVENLNFKLNIFNCFFADELILFDPLL